MPLVSSTALRQLLSRVGAACDDNLTERIKLSTKITLVASGSSICGYTAISPLFRGHIKEENNSFHSCWLL